MPKSGWLKWRSSSACALAVVAFAMLPLLAGNAIDQGLPYLLRGNERFGRTLIEEVDRVNPDRNVVVCPVSLAIVLAAIQNNPGMGSCAMRLEMPSAGGTLRAFSAFRCGCCWRPSRSPSRSGLRPQELDRRQ